MEIFICKESDFLPVTKPKQMVSISQKEAVNIYQPNYDKRKTDRHILILRTFIEREVEGDPVGQFLLQYFMITWTNVST